MIPCSSRIAVLSAVLALAVTVWLHAAATDVQPESPNGRTTIVLSDLHMGQGRSAGGAWHPREDFRWSTELEMFLGAADGEGRSAVDLVLNGDTFELLGSPPSACTSSATLGCSEEEARATLERVAAAHQRDFQALARFAGTGSNRVVFLPGDHDAALLFPGVARRLLDRLGAPAGRATVAAAGFWRSTDGRLYAEHGHQIGFDPHRFDAWPSPFVRDSSGARLQRSWGEALVQPMTERLEEQFPVIDNFAVASAGLKYALSTDSAVTDEESASLLRYFLSITPWQQFRMELDDGEVEPPVWDVASVRSQGAAFLTASLPSDDPLMPIARRASESGLLADVARGLTDDQITAICDFRAATRRARRRFEPVVTQFLPRGPATTECPRTPDTRGGKFEYFWRSRDLVFSRFLAEANRAGASRERGRPIEVFVHGHSHLPDRSQNYANMISGNLLKIPMEGFSPVRGALKPVAVNGGAFQRTLTPVQYERLRAERGVSHDQLLRTLQPDDLAPCYGFVHIPPYTDNPSPVVRYWRLDGGSWQIAPGCGS
jgi:hypothetical protein